MVQKGTIRNEWIEAYIETGDLSEVPEALRDEVKAKASARKKPAPKPLFDVKSEKD